MQILTIYGRVSSKKNKYRMSRGKMHKDHEVVAFEQTVWKETKVQKIKPVSGLVGLTIHLVAPKKNPPDLDGVVTTMCDALQYAKVFDNDRDVVSIVARKHISEGPADKPRVIVYIREVKKDAPEISKKQFMNDANKRHEL